MTDGVTTKTEGRVGETQGKKQTGELLCTKSSFVVDRAIPLQIFVKLARALRSHYSICGTGEKHERYERAYI